MTIDKEALIVFEAILRCYARWKAFTEDEGLLYITVGGEEFCFHDLLDGIKTLPPRQRQALWLVVIEDRRETDAAKIMGFTNGSTPVSQYKTLAIQHLYEYQLKKKEAWERHGGEEGQVRGG